MARINLLPWREELRKQQQQEFLGAILGAAMLTAVLMFLVHSQIDGTIENQKSRNSFLQSEIDVLDRKIKEIKSLEDRKAQFIAKMEVIQRLQGSRPEIVHLFDEVATTIPDGVHINELKQTGSKLTLDGAAQSNARVSAYMRNLDASPWLANPKLSIIETKGSANQGRVSKFTLSVNQKKQDAKNKKGGSKS